MLNKDEILRYHRQIILDEIGEDGQKKLSNAKVLVIGAGGLGSAVLYYLAAAGIGKLGIVDFDVVDESNLQRQILFTEKNIGQVKAKAAQNRITELNHLVTTEVFPGKFDKNLADELFPIYDLIVDATDNFPTKFLINDACVFHNKTFVSAAIYKFQAQIGVFNHDESATYRCVFSESPEENALPNCSEIGVLGAPVGVIGSMQAMEVLKLIGDFGEPLVDKLLRMDFLKNTFQTLRISRNPDTVKLALENYKNFDAQDDDVKEIRASAFLELFRQKPIQVIDVREQIVSSEQFPFELIHLPLSQLERELENLDENTCTVVFCQHGVRSVTAVRRLNQLKPFKEIYSLKGGVLRLIELL